MSAPESLARQSAARLFIGHAWQSGNHLPCPCGAASCQLRIERAVIDAGTKGVGLDRFADADLVTGIDNLRISDSDRTPLVGELGIAIDLRGECGLAVVWSMASTSRGVRTRTEAVACGL